MAGDVGQGGALRLSDSQGESIAALVLGERREVDPDAASPARGGGQFLRRDDDPHVYLSAGDQLARVDTRLIDWADPKVLSVPRDDVVAVAIDHSSTAPVRLRFDDATPVLADMPEGMKLKTYGANGARGAISGLRLTDVLAADARTTDVLALDFDTTYTATLFDGTVYELRLAKSGGKNYLALAASYAEPTLTDDDRASTVTLAAAEEKAAAAERAVPGINDRHAPWIYEVANWAHGNLTKTLSDVVEPIKDDDED